MEIYLTEEIFSRLLDSLAREIRAYYGDNLPVFIGVGISGVEIVGRMPEILGKPKLETYACDVRREDSANEIIDFPVDKVKGKPVLISYVRVDTGKTLQAVSSFALKSGATDAKTLSIAVRSGASCFPHFFCFMIKDEDTPYLLLDGYPPDILLPYPPFILSPSDFVHELSHLDTVGDWFTCGDQRIDKIGAGEYLYYKNISQNCRVFVIEKGGNAVGVLHFYIRNSSAWLETLAISKEMQGKGIGTVIVNFFLNWCKFNGIRWVRLDAFKEREGFYADLGFFKIKEFDIPTYGKFCRMKKKVF